MGRDESFRTALRESGIEYSGELYFDSTLHRIKAEGDHARNCWFVLYPGPPAAGAYGCWKRDFKKTWCERNGSLSDLELDLIRQRWKEASAKLKAVTIARQEKARKVAAWILNRSRPARNLHRYLSEKRINVFGNVRQYRRFLVLPLHDSSGELQSLQFISGDGTKKFLTGGRVAGCFFTLADKADGPLVICEGYATGASIYEAVSHAVFCAMNSGNLLEVAKAARERWPQREIIIAGDDDQFRDGNPGLTKATAAAKAIRAKLAVPQFKDVASKPTDFNDLAIQEGLDAVRQQVGKAEYRAKAEPPRVEVQPRGDVEPVELPPPPTPYVSPPLDLFPDGVQRFIRVGAETFDVDPAFFLLPLLSGAAATIGNARSIRLKEDYIEHPIIWTATIATTGAGKSPVEHAVTAPLRNRESEFIRKNKEAYAQYAKELAAWESKPKKERGEKPQKPPLLTCLMDDTTIEAAAYRLNDNPRGIGLVKDELSHWFESFDQYHDRGGADVSRWLSLWTGNLFALDRVTGGRSSGRSYRIEAPRFSITGGVVPEVFKRLLTDDYFERGLPARFLFAMPPRNRPRKYVDRDIPREIKAELHDLFAQLAALQADTSRGGEQRPKLLALSPEAKQLFKNFHNECASRAFDASPREAAQWSKLSAYSARLALVAELMWDTKADVISGEVMRAACDLARWFGLEAERIYALIGETDWQRDRRKLIEFIERRHGEVTERDVYSNYRPFKNKPNKAKETAEWLDQLVRNSLGKWETVPPTAKGGQPTRKFCLFRPPLSAQPSVSRGEAGGSADADTRYTQENNQNEH